MTEQTRDFISEGAETWTAHGLECAVRPSPLGPLNGYVRLPEDHPMRGKGYDAFNVEAHGGLTYGCDAFGWVGFDTLHLGDWWREEDVQESADGEAMRRAGIAPMWSEDRNKGFPAWTKPKLRAEVERLAEQLADPSRYGKHLKAEHREGKR